MKREKKNIVLQMYLSLLCIDVFILPLKVR